MSTILTVIEVIGVLSFSVSGALMAIDKENDFIGVIFLALVTAFGGGILRDIMIGNHPPIIFENFLLIAVSIITATAVFFLAMIFKKYYIENEETVQKINNYIDALGLGVFVISGVKLCMAAQFHNPIFIILMGMISGTGGSMTRDIIMREVPYLLRKRIYLLAAMAGATSYYLLFKLGMPDVAAVIISASLVFFIRVCATVFKWNMPKAIDFSKLRDDKQ